MLTLLLFCFVYFLPTVVAARRGQPYFGLLLLNFFLGWTVIGWALLLLWAVARAPRLVYVPYGPQVYPPVGYRY